MQIRDMRYWIENTIANVRRVIDYIPTIWRLWDREPESVYIVLRKQLTRLRGNAKLEDSIKINLAIGYIKMLENDCFFIDNEMTRLHNKYGEKLFEVAFDEGTLKYVYELEGKDLHEEHAQAYIRAEARRVKAKDMLFNILKEDLEGWWY